MRKLDELITDVNKNRAQILDDKATAYIREVEELVLKRLVDHPETSRVSQVKAVDYIEVTEWYKRLFNDSEELATIVLARIVNSGYGIEERKILHGPAAVPTGLDFVKSPRELNTKNSVNNLPMKGNTKYYLLPITNRN